ncbi:MAG: 2-dehydro-3-deoxy-6-phosphogalactonate aldolase [Desulfobacterales bacterium]|nr:MAG: 2-dehydro-3-deoxy-6-phosphogalactonate aldolase [Desulfobacterales bacterium]
MKLKSLTADFPFIAILRGIKPSEVIACAQTLFNEGFRIIEVPLNSPDPYQSIELMANHFGDNALIGAGTVTEAAEVYNVKAAGGRLVVSPHCDPEIIRKTKAESMYSIPGAATPTEAVTAIKAGADAIKIFPSEAISPKVVKAIKVVLPQGTVLIPVGGIDHTNWRPYFEAGARAFGLGSSLYLPGRSREELAVRARNFACSWRESEYG